jgi:hypothetical protein
MENSKLSMYKRLRFRRQFLLTSAPIAALAEWKCLKIDQYYLHAHPDLAVNRVADRKRTIVLIGDLFDSEEPEKGNTDILKDIFVSACSLEGFVSRIKRYAGCYALLFMDKKEALILHDARALREIYYCTKSNLIVCGSQPNLVAKFSNPEVKPTSDKDLLDFYREYLWDSRWIGDETFYEGVKHLPPNHYLDINRRKARRYWPNEPIRRLNLEEGVFKSCTFLQGIMRAIVHRQPVMMAVTSGTDSRTLLAASRSIKDKIYFFVNNQGLGCNHPDISVPRKIFQSIEVPFHVQDVSNDVDDKFRRIFLSNTFLATESLLPPIYNVFFKKNSDKTCILGVSEIGRTFYGKDTSNLNIYRMAYKLGYKNCRYVIKQCERLLAEMAPVAKKFGINVWDLLYWEQRLGNWGAVRNSESAIAIEKVDPFDCHLLIETFLGVDDKYRSYKESPCVFFGEIIRNMWPELLEWPINPPHKIRARIDWFLRKVGMFELLKELKYQMHYARYLYKIRW